MVRRSVTRMPVSGAVPSSALHALRRSARVKKRGRAATTCPSGCATARRSSSHPKRGIAPMRALRRRTRSGAGELASADALACSSAWQPWMRTGGGVSNATCLATAPVSSSPPEPRDCSSSATPLRLRGNRQTYQNYCSYYPLDPPPNPKPP
eukprot:2888249-Pleurochrysis_carterae.AAC.18